MLNRQGWVYSVLCLLNIWSGRIKWHLLSRELKLMSPEIKLMKIALIVIILKYVVYKTHPYMLVYSILYFNDAHQSSLCPPYFVPTAAPLSQASSSLVYTFPAAPQASFPCPCHLNAALETSFTNNNGSHTNWALPCARHPADCQAWITSSAFLHNSGLYIFIAIFPMLWMKTAKLREVA